MNSRKRSSSGVFLMEMIMVCGFFLFCAAVCIQVFMKSDSMSRLARERNQAILLAESLAETWKAEGREGLSESFSQTGEDLVLFFDENWERIGESQRQKDTSLDEYMYTAQLKWEETAEGAGVMEALNLVIERGISHPHALERDKDGLPLVLYSLQVKKYRRQGGG